MAKIEELSKISKLELLKRQQYPGTEEKWIRDIKQYLEKWEHEPDETYKKWRTELIKEMKQYLRTKKINKLWQSNK